MRRFRRQEFSPQLGGKSRQQSCLPLRFPNRYFGSVQEKWGVFLNFGERLSPFLDTKSRKNISVRKLGNAIHFIMSDEMERDQLQRLIKNFHGGVWPWVKTRPANHWIFRLALSLGEDHLAALPQIINEMSGWRGFPSRRVLKLAELREELIEHWDLYKGKSVQEALKILEGKIGLRITPKCFYGYMEKFGLKRNADL